MSPSDIDEFISNWDSGKANLFKYSRPLVPDEYIAIEMRDDMFVSLPVSTYVLKPMDLELMRKMMGAGELTYKCWYYEGLDVRSYKTGNCNCGSWILKENKYLHNTDCPCYCDPDKKRW